MMEPGPELDALVAEGVMGLSISWEENTPCPYCGSEMRYCGARSRCTQCAEWRHGPYKEYSTDDGVALEILRHMSTEGWGYTIYGRTGGTVTVLLERTPIVDGCLMHSEQERHYVRSGEGLAHAACLVSLKAKGVEVE